MPMKYNEDTGIPYFVPDTAIELDEGVTPKPDVLRYGKRGIFAGDPPPKFDNGLGQKPVDSTTRIKGKQNVGKPIGGIKGEQTQAPDSLIKRAIDHFNPAYDEAFDVDKIAESAKPAGLSAKIATDEEVEQIERLAHEQSVKHWPTLLRLINRLRMTEELLRVEREQR